MSHVLAAYQYERPYEVGILFIMLCLSPKQLNVFFWVLTYSFDVLQSRATGGY
jgi:hypothetical protein